MDDVIERLRRRDPVPEPLAPPPIEPLLSRLDDPPAAATDRSRRFRARSPQSPRSPWSARAGIRHLPVMLAVGTSVLVAVLALSLLRSKPSGPSRPSHTRQPAAAGPAAFPHLSRRQRKQIDDVMKADGAVVRRDGACTAVVGERWGPGRKPSLNQGSPSAAMLATIGTLDRAATRADQLPPRKIWDGPHSKPRTYPYGTYPTVIGIYARYIRYARHRDGANYYLVPAKDVNWREAVPARCYSEQVTALREELPKIPRTLRRGIFALQSIYLAYERRSTDPYPGVCLVAINDTGNGDGASCYAVSEIRAGHTLSSGAPAGVPVVYGLAPDGVRSVTFYYSGRYSRHPLTALVINNVFILHDPGDRLPEYGFPYKLLWRAANGRVLKTITWR